MSTAHPQAAWAVETLWQSLAPLWPGITVELVPQIDSTNTELMRRARSGLAEPVLLIAEQQSAGRGRLGKQWHSQGAQALTFSLGLPLAPRDWSGLSLAVGLALAESLHPALHIKWPNDLWLADGRKICGILIETASLAAPGAAQTAGSRYTVIGVGLNIRAPQALPDGANQGAGLQECMPGITAAQALQAIAPALLQAVSDFADQGFAPLLSRFAERDVLRGRRVTLSDGRSGQCLGVAADGALLVDCGAGPEPITSAEVSVRPQTL